MIVRPGVVGLCMITLAREDQEGKEGLGNILVSLSAPKGLQCVGTASMEGKCLSALEGETNVCELSQVSERGQTNRELDYFSWLQSE